MMPASTADRGQLYPQTAGPDPSILLRAVDPERVAAEWETLDAQLDALEAERDARYLDQITHTYDEHGRAVAAGPLRWRDFAGRTDLDPQSDVARDLHDARAISGGLVEDAIIVDLPMLAPPDAVAVEAARQLGNDALIDAITAAVGLLIRSPRSLLRFQAAAEHALAEEKRNLAASEASLQTLTGNRESDSRIRGSLGRQAAWLTHPRRARQRREAAGAVRRTLQSHRLRIVELEARLAAIEAREMTRGAWLRRHHEQLARGAAAVIALNERDLLVELDSRGLVVRDPDGQVLEHAVRVVRVLAGHLPAYFGGVDLPDRQDEAIRALVLGASLAEVIDQYVTAGRRRAARMTALAFPSMPTHASETADGATAAEGPDGRLGPLPPGPGAVFARLNRGRDLPPADHPLAQAHRTDRTDDFALGERAAGCLRTENSDAPGLRESAVSAWATAAVRLGRGRTSATSSAPEEPAIAGGEEDAR
jgi:hypothetical protein